MKNSALNFPDLRGVSQPLCTQIRAGQGYPVSKRSLPRFTDPQEGSGADFLSLWAHRPGPRPPFRRRCPPQNWQGGGGPSGRAAGSGAARREPRTRAPGLSGDTARLRPHQSVTSTTTELTPFPLLLRRLASALRAPGVRLPGVRGRRGLEELSIGYRMRSQCQTEVGGSLNRQFS